MIPTLRELEQEAILEALWLLKGNRTNAAKALGISLRTLRNRLKEYRKQGCVIAEPNSTRERGKTHDTNRNAKP